jgi:uncharacterized protein (TIGR02996 family)
MMRTFVFQDSKSHKFWNIELQGNSFTVTFGKVGAKGQTQTKTFADAAKAQKEFDKFVKEKFGKGYVETTAAAASAVPAAPVSPVQQALEESLVANPDDLGAHAAYADFLMEQGDPRGEFIQVQLRLEQKGSSGADRRALKRREQALLKKHGGAWLGELGPYLSNDIHLLEELEYEPNERGRLARYRYLFGRGWLTDLEVPYLSFEFAKALAGSPEMRLLRRLVIVRRYDDELIAAADRGGLDLDDRFPGLVPLSRATTLANVRVFQLGEAAGNGVFGVNERSYCHTDGAHAAELARAMPKLEELCLYANRVSTKELFALKTLTRLRVLLIYHSWVYPLEVLAKNAAFGSLTHLLLHPKAATPWWASDQPYIKAEGVRAVLNSRHLKGLTHLQLRCTDIGDAGCEAVVRSGILKRLKVLDLRHGCITDAGARTLAACPDLKNLELLDLARNALTKAGIKVLKQTGVKVFADYQHAPDDTEYLYDGDIE